MGRKCTICGHRQRKKIDSLLQDSVTPLRWIAKIFDVSHTALFRHKYNHLHGREHMDGLTERVQIAKQVVPIETITTLKREGKIWDSYTIRFQGEELMTYYLKKVPNLIFNHKELTKLFSIEEVIDNDS